ncbi:hypothetical protein [Qipengyuania sp.]|uniref:hypothetical protein n=1 Tax=Qipengyuania sp. TaxID=2004515 RepID=UPI003516D338
MRDALREAVLAVGGGLGSVIFHNDKAWSADTFSGTRHTLRIEFDGPEEVEGGEKLVDELASHEFSIPGQLVADAGVEHVEHRMLGNPRMVVTASLLLMEVGR